MATVTTDPLLGRLVDGRYEIVARIARGGMATVYRATDRRLDREVALKIMHPHLADGVEGASFVSRFRREARAAARLTHPGVVAVYDQGLDGETSYLTMEYVPGTNLRRELRSSGTLTLGRTLDVLAQVLAALAAAHRKGLVHRDVKPENVLITADGAHVKVADFGLARAVTEVTSTATGTILGTVAYLAPEVITTGGCDARTDVYAVGILAYEMLTGALPYAGETPIQVAFHHVHDDVPAPSGEVPWLPAEVDELVAAFTARDPGRRPADAAAALDSLERVRAGLDPDLLDRRADLPATAGAVDADSPAGDAGDDSPEADGIDSDRLDAIPAAFFQEVSAPDERTEMLVEESTTRVPGRPAADRTHSPAAPPRRRRRRRALAWTLTLLLLVAGGAAGTWWWFADGPGAWTRVPDGVVAVPLEDARDVLAAAELGSTVTRSHHDEVPAGTVIESRPAPGDPVRTDGQVHLVVSRGIRTIPVPDGLVGATHQDATAALRAAGFEVGEPSPQHHDTVPEGEVMAVSVPEGSVQPHTTVVTLTVSDGPAPVTVPQQVGKPKDDAVADLESVGLKVELAEPEHSLDVAEGHVLRQDPEAGAQAHRTDTVTLTLSAGPPIVAVPDVVGMRTGAARAALEEAGFEVEENKYLGGLLDTVRFQDTTGEAPQGSTVTLTIW
ncbi:Stk1 family PASTA domain-containing Ser/Thr kinase [Isoptericola variabilis]|uniref:non-specific serine/threonine protein kinase n=1 Tax=Isoptericola variabilis (strain 225) TaxID=743718 RepID=F6FWI4_ISOV2|nr:Stk1 family PASTA domain-containing Ser/Thr kinase [Isoptericola variabilis]AEG44558.1 serine/threonine protein kinase with PASTA sensor(s) [Isoptericola variabilis 225]TWH26525.1 serine/threonine-protein kinase [Isoptericola variabilis J7]